MKAPLTPATPWAPTNADRRLPTPSELASGFPCGPADRELFNELMNRLTGMEAELANLTQRSGFAHNAADLNQVLAAVRSQRLNYAEAAGSANALTATLTPALAAYTAGLPLRVKASAANTGGASLNVNGLGALPIRYADGANVTTGAWSANAILDLVCTGTAFVLVGLTSAPAAGGGGGGGDPFSIQLATAAGTASAITADYTPNITSPANGKLALLDLTAAIAGPTTISVDGAAAVPLVNSAGGALAAGYAISGDRLLICYESSPARWRVLSRTTTAAGSINYQSLPMRAWARADRQRWYNGVAEAPLVVNDSEGFSGFTRIGYPVYSPYDYCKIECTLTTPLANPAKSIVSVSGVTHTGWPGVGAPGYLDPYDNAMMGGGLTPVPFHAKLEASKVTLYQPLLAQVPVAFDFSVIVFGY